MRRLNAPESTEIEANLDVVQHEDNEFGIELCDEGQDASHTSHQPTTSGVKYAYQPATQQAEPSQDEVQEADNGLDLADLMSKLKGL